jgi:hypothetical protein
MKNKEDIRERTVAKYLKSQVERFGGFMVKIKGEGHSGIPDYLIGLKGLHLVEAKRPKGGKISDMQKYVSKRFSENSVIVNFVFNNIDVDIFIIKTMLGLCS